MIGTKAFSLLALIAASLCGCGGGQDMSYSFVVDATATQMQYESVVTAAQQWNACSVVSITVRQGDDYHDKDIRIIFGDDYIGAGNGGATFKKENKVTDIRIRPYGKVNELLLTSGHEMGHAINATDNSPDVVDEFGHTATGLMQAKKMAFFSEYECNNLRISRGMK